MPGRSHPAIVVCACALAGTTWAGHVAAQTGITVHEWGTFTTVAGADGRAVEWLPLSGPADLPCFVQRYQNNPLIKLGPDAKPLDYESARAQLWGRVRMETPVLYFYSPRQTAVSVRVEFPRGLMTEWYPRARVTQAVASAHVLRDAAHVSVIEWPAVTIAPGAAPVFPSDVAESHYYAARATDAAPVVVNGEAEKFLFYRGVADFDVPLTAELLPHGAIRIRNVGSEQLPVVIVFENRAGAIGYRLVGALADSVTVAPPVLNATVASLRAELGQQLVRAGLYPKEAAAMLDTWRDSWFEEGARVFYILPSGAVDAVLPLTISPAPAHVTRVFVGRIDLLTPAARRAVALAVAGSAVDAVERYGRLLGPLTDGLLAVSTDASQQAGLRRLRNAALARYVARSSGCH